MAGDWIKVDHGLSQKPEVMAIAATLGISRRETVGTLLDVWSWFDAHTENGNARSVTPALLNDAISVTGFAEAMQAVGWLSVNDEGITMPKFDRHNSKSAKARALTNERVKRSRNGQSVTKALPEKRREEVQVHKRGREVGRLPISPEQAVEWAGMEMVPVKFATKVYHQLNGRDWVDGAGQMVTNWRSYIHSRWIGEQVESDAKGGR